ncbi:hypothetical protein KP509_15G000200 [Ceratopteris richardii]|uniref:Germin-like protein n=1 Tax=Ceratopteris richardii TaxID=49495 RepID=A0A8T2T4Q7_CERRI|nr:hypothetical protein KP509_15G000200 [Ceratopteris richardii]
MAIRELRCWELLTPLVTAWILIHAGAAFAADADPIFDYCVADSTQSSIFFNGLPCKDPSTVTAADFTSTAFRAPGNTSNPLGIAIAVAAAGPGLPGLNTQSLTLVRFEYAKDGGFVPLHIHPRASELITVTKGAVQVGFIDSSNKFFSTTLYKGDSFLFPRGLIHYQLSVSSSPAKSYSSLNSQNPGIVLLPPNLFGSTPSIPDIVLEKSFSLSKDEVDRIKASFGAS